MNLDKALEIIKKYEKCILTAYLCPVKIWSVGWGTTRYEVTERVINGAANTYAKGCPVSEGDILTQEQADAELLHHAEDTSQRIIDLCYPVELNENQHNALVSLVYNIGVGNFRGSTLLKFVHETKPTNYQMIANEFLKWNKGRVDGKLIVLDGLTKRREEERTLFLA